MKLAPQRPAAVRLAEVKPPELEASSAIKGLIWLYILLLIFEGTLRKWVFPGLSGPLLFIRDPVVLAIYALAIAEGRFPSSISNTGLLLLSVICTLLGAVINATHPLVTIYGFKANFAHLPLIFVLGRVLQFPHVLAIGRMILFLAILMLPVVIQQFQTGPSSWWNVGAGGTIGGQIAGAMGKVRASGFFSFVTGIGQFCALQAAFVIYGFLVPRTFNRALLYSSTVSLILTLALSTSRGALGAVATVFLMVGIIFLLNPSAAGRLGRAGAAFGFVVFLVSGLNLFKDGTEVMTARMEGAGDLESGVTGASSAWTERVLTDFGYGFEAIDHAPLLGYGIGLGTNVGAVLVKGGFGYLLAEAEWPRVILEMGPVFGIIYLVLRIGILIAMFRSAAVATKAGNVLPLLLFGASCWLILSGQFGQVTTVGFAVVCAGLCFASVNSSATATAVGPSLMNPGTVRSRSRYAEFLYGEKGSRPH